MPGRTSTAVKTLFVEPILVLSQFLNALNLLIVVEISITWIFLVRYSHCSELTAKGDFTLQSPEKDKTFLDVIVAVVVVLQP